MALSLVARRQRSTGAPDLGCLGRKPGRPRRNPVTNGLDGDVFWIVAEHGHRAGYVRNIEANPGVRGYVWWCALTGRRGPFLRPAITALVGEGVVVIANRGNCPLGPVGDRIGDPIPLFELVLSRRAARGAVPTLGVVTAAGLGLLAARSRSRPASR